MADNWEVQKERSNPFLLRFICKFALSMPRSIARLWLWPISLYFFCFSPAARSASSDYLRRHPNMSSDTGSIYKHIHTFASVILDRVYFITGHFEKFNISYDLDQEALAVLDGKDGAILLGAHIGSFEAMRCLAIKQADFDLKILMYRDHNAMITRILDELNSDIANSVINISDANALLQAQEFVETGGVIGLLGDRGVAGEKVCQSSLLGDKVEIPAGPFSLSLILRVPVVVFFATYAGGNNYHITLKKLCDPIDVPRNRRSEIIRELTSDYIFQIENILRRYPYNWFNFYDYWGAK
ncbi:MAG: lipid A biosynthesis acyltransferase [Thiohalophilus sp.]|uniref:lipid A biosynthesis acyltransferase n=1 Tax=Thiohalophilus sp. TaxID=3028392 RepID=UPI0028705D73|nr:lipid A biosynthesis acyltransferase [Thiohalophilus sp.]MDR9435518.1 lipid A biosynthesis acyltransferase [Thiohalophilus sp.]